MPVNRIREFGKENARPEKVINKRLHKKIFEHQKTINQMLSLIALVPMDTELKMILRFRIWGKTPDMFAPMTYEDIANMLKCRIKDVEKWENDAKYNVELYLKKTSIKDACEKVVRDNRIKDIIDPDKRIIV